MENENYKSKLNTGEEAVINSFTNGDLELFKTSWETLSADGRRNVANAFYKIDNEDFGKSVFNYLISSYDNQDDIGKKPVVIALGRLGARCEQVDMLTTDYLLEKSADKKELSIELISALKEKAVGFCLPLLTDEKIYNDRKERLDKIIDLLCSIIKDSNFDDEVRLEAIRGAGNLRYYQRARVELGIALSEIMKERKFEDRCADELVDLAEPGNRMVLENFSDRLEKLPPNTTELTKMHLIQGLGRVGTEESIGILSHYLEDTCELVRSDAKIAIGEIKKRNENLNK